MTRADVPALAAVVFADEIINHGTVDAWNEYEALLAAVPRHDTPISVQWAFAGPDLLEPEE